MLEISEEQMAALGLLGQERFERRLLNHLRAEHSKAVSALDDATLERRARAALTRARSRGITAESTLVAFVATMFEIGPLFDRQPEIAGLLASPLFGPDGALDAAARMASDAAWAEAAEAASDGDWATLDRAHS